MSADLLIEIGCEEVPARMLERQLAELPALVTAKLAAARIAHGEVRALGTPRRVAIHVAGIAERQPDLDEEIVGPPVGAAFAPDGTLTKAGQGFAAKNGVGADQIEKKEVAGKKGMYAVAKKHVAGADARALLPAILAEVVTGMPWPKSQRWGWGEEKFVRPVQWIVALFGGEVVPFTFGELASGRRTKGHRFLSRGWIDLETAELSRYIVVLRAQKVLVDPGERRARVEAELARVATETGLTVRPDPGLVAEVTNLGEWPTGVVGTFDAAFLAVPEEIIVTAMRNHQRYFAVEDPATKKLAPKFVTMMATEVADTKLVEKGNQYVIASRLSDAKFFVEQDRKRGSFDYFNDKLATVTFQAKLPDGQRMIADKVRRIVAIVEQFGGDHRAARACKADLASEAVGEFPELQGVMGRHYATDFGFPAEVGRAIEEHWWPKGGGAAIPTTRDGALIALADKLDTIVGCFGAGLEPSGSADPLGLRRAAIGVWQILLGFPELGYDALVTAAEAGLGMPHAPKLDEFMKTRLRGILVETGLPAQDTDAALAQGWKDPCDAQARARACGRISKEAREVFKRVANILDDARAKKLEIAGACDPRLFGNPVEQNLYDAVAAAQERERSSRAAKDYAGVFESLEQLRPTVAAFFDKGGVMVMDPDPKLRDNRLALLQWFVAPYLAIADFRLLAGAAT